MRPQDRAEALAERLAGDVLGIVLKKQREAPPKKTPDFRPERGEDGRLAIEVKMLTVQQSVALDARLDDVTRFQPCSSLRFTWLLSIDRPSLDQRLPAHLPTTIKTQTLEDYAAGKPPSVIPHPERKPRGFELPDFGHLRREAERLLSGLELAGLMTTLGAEWRVPEAGELVALLRGGMALAHVPVDQPGYQIVVGSGFARTGTGEPLVARIAMYLASPAADNLRDTLVEGVEPDEVRHAFLVLDGTEPELFDRSWLPDSPPVTLLELPPMIDRLWVGIEPDLVMWLDRHDARWQARRVT